MERLFLAQGGLTDYTELLDYYSSASAFVLTTSDYFYMASLYPFNNFWAKMGVANTNSANVSVEYWADEWKTAVEVVDDTNGFQQDGYIYFTPDKRSRWFRESTRENDQPRIPELSTVTIYDMYWMRISVDANLSAGTTLKYIGHKFCSDSDLFAEYREFKNPNFISAYESGKTDWEEQIVRASDLIVKDMVAKNIIVHKGQLLDHKKLLLPTVPKTAGVIYQNLGDDYKDDLKNAKLEAASRLSNQIFHVDHDNDARLEYKEAGLKAGHFFR